MEIGLKYATMKLGIDISGTSGGGGDTTWIGSVYSKFSRVVYYMAISLLNILKVIAIGMLIIFV